MKSRTSLLLVIAAEMVVILLGVLSYGWTIQGLQAATRFSGRLSLFIFSFIFLLHPQQKQKLKDLMSDKFLLAFAVAHGIHLIELLSYVYLSQIQLVPIRVAGGFFAYILIFIMPFLYQRNLLNDKRGNALMLFYQFYVWFVIFMTYVVRLKGDFPNAGGTHTEYVALFGIVCVLLVVKIYLTFRKREVTNGFQKP
jgi:hypothetical protein